MVETALRLTLPQHRARRLALAVLIPVGLMALFLELSGYSSLTTARALFEGAFGSGYAFEGTLLRACPLLLCGLAVTLCFRAGLWNIGAEGQLLAGALAAAAVGTRLTSWPVGLLLPTALLAASCAGALVGGIAGGLRAFRGVPEVVSTLMLNFVLLQAIGWSVQGPLQEESGAYPQGDLVAVPLPRFGDGRLHGGLVMALVITLALEVLLFATRIGFRWRAFGLNPEATRAAGVRPRRLIVGLLLGAGAVAGLGGGIEILGVTLRLLDGFSPGYGYSAIAVALLGGLRPSGVLVAAFLFGALEAGAGRMQRFAGVPAAMTYLAEAMILLSVLWVTRPPSRRSGGVG